MQMAGFAEPRDLADDIALYAGRLVRGRFGVRQCDLDEAQRQIGGGTDLLLHGETRLLDDENGAEDQYQAETQRDLQIQARAQAHE